MFVVLILVLRLNVLAQVLKKLITKLCDNKGLFSFSVTDIVQASIVEWFNCLTSVGRKQLTVDRNELIFFEENNVTLEQFGDINSYPLTIAED